MGIEQVKENQLIVSACLTPNLETEGEMNIMVKSTEFGIDFKNLFHVSNK